LAEFLDYSSDSDKSGAYIIYNHDMLTKFIDYDIYGELNK